MQRPAPTRDGDRNPIRLLAADYDGTLADDGKMGRAVTAALHRAKRSGIALALVTGRGFDDLTRTCDAIALFDLVVAEDGAVLHLTATGKVHLLAEPPSRAFLDTLERERVPYSRGRVIVSTERDNAAAVERAITATGLDLAVSRNKGAVMVLPRGVDKGTGLMAGLRHLELTPDAVVAFGDAENDLAFLRLARVSVAVANALELVKREATVVTDEPSGAGVAAFIHAHLDTGPTTRSTRDVPSAG